MALTSSKSSTPTGKVVQRYDNLHGPQVTLAKGDLSAGVYWLRVTAKDQRYEMSLVVE